MTELEYITLYQRLTHKAMINTHSAFRGNPKLILTESDLKCWLYLELQQLIKQQLECNLSIHTEVTHYSGNLIKNNCNNQLRKEYFMRDLTILDFDNLNLNNALWNSNDKNLTRSKGFNHNGPALHFELKLLREPNVENGNQGIDVGDITKLNNVGKDLSRAYTIVIGSKTNNLISIQKKVEEKLKQLLNLTIRENDLLRIYLFDTNSIQAFKVNQNQLATFYPPENE
jgi:hypothetical protein